MAKIPFDIKYKPQLESGEYKVETRDGKSARILCWDKMDECEQYIVALVQYTPEHEDMISACEDGIYKGTYGHGYDLFIVTPEPMKFHLYGQHSLVELPKDATVQDLRTLSWFNRIIKNYLKMKKIEKK